MARALIEYSLFGLSMKEAVFVLNADKSCRASPARRCRLSISYLLHRKVRAANLAGLSRLHQLVERAQRLGDGDVQIGNVLLIEMDVVGAESLHAGVECLSHVGRVRAVGLSWHVTAELRGNDHLGATISQKAAKQLLALAVGVGVGGIEEVESFVECRVYDFLGAHFVDAPAEVIATYANDRHLE